MFADTDFFMFLVLFSKKITFQLKTYRIYIGNLEDLLRLMLINEKCGNPQVVVNNEELNGNITQKKKPGILQACRCPLCDKCCRQEYFFNKHLEYCESVR